jgi:hypothetical protein
MGDSFKEYMDFKKSDMFKFYEKRTKEHIDRVIKYGKNLSKKHPEIKGIVERCKLHDKSKYSVEEQVPYVHLSWYYKLKNEGKEYTYPQGMKKRVDIACEHHVCSNKHHPEAHKSPNDMTPLDLAEMIADWCSMSEEMGNDPKGWADKTVGSKWNFNEENTKLIYELIEKAWSK